MSGFGGILPAAVTPLDARGRFRPDAFERLLARLYAAGAHGVYVCGTTGEGMLLPAGERRAVAEAAVALSPPGAQVLVHVGAASTAEAVALARHAAGAGASAVSSLPPVGGYSFREVRAHYERLAADAGLPLFLYHFPEIAPVPVSRAQLLELCALPGVGGLKLTDFDLFTLWQLRREGVTVFNGRDEVLAAGLLMGADGGIGTFYNLMPATFVRIFTLARAGDWEGARAAQARVGELIRVVAGFPLLPAVKRVLEWSGIECGECLLPRTPLTAEEEARLRAELERAGLAEEVGLAGGERVSG